MKTREHFFFKIDKEDIQKTRPIGSIIRSLRLPRNKFPPEFFVQEKNFFCAGYFVCYNQDVTIDKLVLLCKKHDWRYIANLVGDFLILCCDLNSKQLFVLTDQTGKFPCYFSKTHDVLFLSTNFYDIVKLLPSPSLDISAALDYLHRNMGVTDRTIIDQIQQVPPATLFTFESNGSYSLEPLVDFNRFVNKPFVEHVSVEKFSETFLASLENLVLERLRVIGNLQFCADITSGFDSSLISYLLKENSTKPFICYSRAAKAAIQDTNPRIVSEFAEKHDLNLKFVPYDHIFPFSTEDDLEWIRRGPSQITKFEVYHHFLTMHENKDLLYFTGDGGDEIYRMDAITLDLELRFPVQKEYFERLTLREFGIDKVLSKKGVETLFNRKRFQQKRAYPLLVAASAATIHMNNIFPLSWEAQVWPITPFVDPRLAQTSRGIPKKNGKVVSKQEIWRHRKGIFVPSQFAPKGGPDDQIKRYLTERSKFVVSVLENSLLGDKGWVKASEIIDNVRKGNVREYYESNVMSYIANLLELEYFLQHNKVKIPN